LTSRLISQLHGQQRFIHPKNQGKRPARGFEKLLIGGKLVFLLIRLIFLKKMLSSSQSLKGLPLIGGPVSF
jgi:hypothetical protein